MPYGDGTGPLGNGPRTGRQMGNCPGAQRSSQPQAFFGRRGFFCRRDMGGVYATLSKEELTRILEAELVYLDERRKIIQQRLEKLKG